MKTVLPILLALHLGTSLQSSPCQEKNPTPATLEQDTSTYEGAFSFGHDFLIITKNDLRDSFNFTFYSNKLRVLRGYKPYDSSFKIIRYTIYILPPSRPVQQYQVDSNGFTESIIKQIDSLEPGGRIIIDGIKANYSTGQIRLQPETLTWIDETTYLSAIGKVQDYFWQSNETKRIKEDLAWRNMDSLMGYSNSFHKLTSFKLILIEPNKVASEVTVKGTKIPDEKILEIEKAAVGSKIIVYEICLDGMLGRKVSPMVFIKYANIHEYVQQKMIGQ